MKRTITTKTDVQEIFKSIVDVYGPEAILDELMEFVSSSSSEDFLFEQSIINALEKFIKDNT